MARLSYVPQTPEAFSYDGDGNLTQDGLWQYTWDGENRLKRIETRTNAITDSAYWQRIDCDYDYMSRRVRKQVFTWNPSTNNYHLSTSTRCFYDGWNLIGQVDEVTGTRLSFLWGTDLSGSLQGAGGVGGLKAMTVHNGASAGTYFYGYDGNGNVAVLVNAAEQKNRVRFEESLEKIANGMKCGETKTFHDYWDAQISHHGRGFSFDELFFASGDSTLTSTGDFR